MAFHDTEHINQIGYYKQFANDVRVKNMQLFHSMDARIVSFDFKNMADSWTTYSALECLKTRGLDWVSLWRWLAIDWDMSQALKMSLTLISISHFFVILQVFVLPPQVISNPDSRVHRFLMYYTIH